MKFFLYEIVARVVAICLCLYCGRTLRNGLRERKIAYINSDLLDWWWQGVIQRDAAPIQYWMTITILTFVVIGCLLTAIFGWHQTT
jgi:hypothetical protein